MLMAVLDATADAMLCRPQSPTKHGTKISNVSDALEIYNVVDDESHDSSAHRPSSPLTSSQAQKAHDRAMSPASSPRPVSAWERHANARSVGVRALQSLAARHTQTIAEKEQCEAMALEAISVQQDLAQRVEELDTSQRALAAKLRHAHTQIREAAQREKDKDREHARAIDMINKTKAGEARGLMKEIDRFRNASQLAHHSLNSSELALVATEQDKSGQEEKVRKLELANTQLLAQAAHASSVGQEAERNLAIMDDNFSVARAKLKSVSNYAQNIEKIQSEKLTALQCRNAILENIFREEAALRQHFEFELRQTKQTTSAQIADLTLKVKVYEDENTSLGKGLGGKNKKLKGEMNDLQIVLTRRTGLGNWYWLLAMCYMCNKPDVSHVGAQIGTPAFPAPKEVAVQTAGAGGLGRGGNTGRLLPGSGFYSGLGEFQAYFQLLLKQALDVSVEDMQKVAFRMPERMLLEYISFFYSKKLIVDQIDDREHRPRQHLAFFIYDYYVSQARTATEGSQAFLKLLANVVQYLPRTEPEHNGGEDSPHHSRPASPEMTAHQRTSSASHSNTHTRGTSSKKMLTKKKASAVLPATKSTATTTGLPVLRQDSRVDGASISNGAAAGAADAHAVVVQKRAAQTARERQDKWLVEQRVEKNHVKRIEMFANLLGANSMSKWDLGMQFEASEVFLETLLRVRKGHTPLLPYETSESGKELLVPSIDLASTIEVVCAKIRSVDRQKIKIELETALKVLHNGKMWLNLDSALQRLVEYWKTLVYDSIDARLESLFVSADNDQSGELDYHEFTDMVEKVATTGNSSLSSRSVLRMYSQMSLHEKVDAAVFCKVARSFELAKIRVGRGTRLTKESKPAQEKAAVFKLLKGHWQHLEGKVLPVVFSLKQSPQGNVMEELVSLLRSLLREEEDAEQAVHCFRSIVADMPPAIRSEIQQTKDLKVSKHKI